MKNLFTKSKVDSLLTAPKVGASPKNLCSTAFLTNPPTFCAVAGGYDTSSCTLPMWVKEVGWVVADADGSINPNFSAHLWVNATLRGQVYFFSKFLSFFFLVSFFHLTTLRPRKKKRWKICCTLTLTAGQSQVKWKMFKRLHAIFWGETRRARFGLSLSSAWVLKRGGARPGRQEFMEPLILTHKQTARRQRDATTTNCRLILCERLREWKSVGFFFLQRYDTSLSVGGGSPVSGCVD